MTEWDQLTHPDASQAGKTVVILAARWENPWLLVIKPRTTTRARVRVTMTSASYG